MWKQGVVVGGLIVVFLLAGCGSGEDPAENSDAEELNVSSVQETESRVNISGLINAADGKYHGIDVSHHQGAIDWQIVKESGVAFVYVKATEGVDYTDPLFYENWLRIKEAGLPVGAYHMFRPEDTAEDQVANFVGALKQAGFAQGDLLPVLDIESVSSIKSVLHIKLHERAVRFLKLVERELGCRPIVYTNPHFWADYLTDVHELTNYQLWVAEYNNDINAPETAGWDSWTMWQFSETGTLQGVEKELDFSRLASELESLRHLGSDQH